MKKMTSLLKAINQKSGNTDVADRASLELQELASPLNLPQARWRSTSPQQSVASSY